MPLAYAAYHGGVVESGITEKGIAWIEETYRGVCTFHGADPDGDYESIAELLRSATP